MSAYSYALTLLARRELTAFELRERLLKNEIPETEADEIVTRLRADGTLNDRRAAVALVRTHATVKARGRIRIEHELKARGVAPDVARAAIDEVFAELSEPELLERALRKRLRSGHIATQAQFRRLYAYLVRLGFPTEQVVGLLKKHMKAGGHPEA
jgi:regulatory protein